MLINLRTAALKGEQQALTIEIKNRLPSHFLSPCQVHCLFTVKQFEHYYLVNLQNDSRLTLLCQRCLGEFSYHYHNQSELAVCDSEETAEKMMSRYDCLVSNNQVDLQDLLTDELHLYVPEMHADSKHCNPEVGKFISTTSE